jgi:endonuclease-8
MPEGPSIVILKEQLQPFRGRRVLEVGGNTKFGKERLSHQTLKEIKSWGKHLLLCFPGFTVRVHFLLFGSYLINETKNANPRLSLRFSNGRLNLYACSLKYLEEKPEEIYDWRIDTLSEKWDYAEVRSRLKKHPDWQVCDAILSQDIFAGAGNIFKNEVLFRIRIHPESLVGNLPARKLRQLILETRKYAFQFYEWKKQYVLRKHWLAHAKSICPRCVIPFTRKHLGKTQRRSFYCENCQVRY